jgi:hypothetical protein
VFIGIIAVGLVYVWGKGALEWEYEDGFLFSVFGFRFSVKEEGQR